MAENSNETTTTTKIAGYGETDNQQIRETSKAASNDEEDAGQSQSQVDVNRTALSEEKPESSTSASDTNFCSSQRVFKKSSQNGKLTLYLVNRDLIVTAGKIDKLQGVVLVDPELLNGKKIYGQVTLTFRYGREDEEVMGLKFCNEAIMALAQLYPPYRHHHTSSSERKEVLTPLQEALIKRFGSNAHPFSMSVTHLAPPSVQLVPAKEYNGAPIGTSYDLRIFAAERPDEKPTRKTQIIRMGIRVIQGASSPPPSRNFVEQVLPEQEIDKIAKDEPQQETPIPQAIVEKPFLLSDGKLRLEASLDQAVYAHGEPITVNISIVNNSNKSVKKIETDIIQHVDVCMFSNGKFKNIVAQLSSREDCPIDPGFCLTKKYVMRPEKGTTKNWIALEDSYTKAGASLASTVLCAGNSPEDRNVFAIYVSYYVKIKLVLSPIGDWIGGGVSVKLPFTLMHSNTDPDFYGVQSPTDNPSQLLERIEHVGDSIERLHEAANLIDKRIQYLPRNKTTMFATATCTTTCTNPTKMEQISASQSIKQNKEKIKQSLSNADLIENYEDDNEKDT